LQRRQKRSQHQVRWISTVLNRTTVFCKVPLCSWLIGFVQTFRM
jgi:hypothetical protein